MVSTEILFAKGKQLNASRQHSSPMAADTSGRRLKTVNTTVRVIEALNELDGAGVTELAEHLDLSKAAVHTHLATLRENRLVVQRESEYQLGLRLVTIGEYVKQHNGLYQAGKEPTDTLSEETGEYAHLMAEEHGWGIHLYKSKADRAVAKEYHQLNLERPYHLHHNSLGKAILAFLPEDRTRAIIDEYGLPQWTENTITDEGALLEELADVRERGYAINDEEEIIGLRAVGAPVRESSGRVLGAVSVSGPVSRMKGEVFESTIPEQVMQAANIIELNVETSSA